MLEQLSSVWRVMDKQSTFRNWASAGRKRLIDSDVRLKYIRVIPLHQGFLS